ncbi:hypothetical protein BRADI_1g10831v3 [Brachypodium distachyon]|uniref:Glycosyltransferase n=1 Tax=Brachypodium distachyon TaxID=15368 RepID=A0A0Q3J6N3_BRADI|nr:hypothetical protein BRADI_1g10831v3 [Brachypodium distachyon]
MDDGSSSSPLHVVICPWLAFGHLLPCLDLAQCLASRGHRVSFVSTPCNIACLLLLLGASCAEGGKKLDWVIVDIFHHWAAADTLEYKVPIGAANVIATWHGRLVKHTTMSKQEQPASKLPRFEIERRQLSTTQRASGMSIAERISLTLRRCNLVVMRTRLEWEPESVPLAASLGGKPVISLGLLPPLRKGCCGVTEDGKNIMCWLDLQPAKSVVYVALGTEVPLPVEQMHELALRLELAGMQFLWALRKPRGDLKSACGLVTTGLAPQINILAHGAVGTFLTHCGWSLTIEGLLFGHPLIMLPMFGDQGPNARLMEGRKVGVQVPRNEGDGSFDREGVATTVRAVTVEEEGKRIFTSNAKKMQEIKADTECQERYINGFIKKLRSYKEPDLAHPICPVTSSPTHYE